MTNPLSVPALGQHPIDHLQEVLYRFKSTFGGKGIICAINTLLNLDPLGMTEFYCGGYLKTGHKCPFCKKMLK
jgi:hypothetical protein